MDWEQYYKKLGKCHSTIPTFFLFFLFNSSFSYVFGRSHKPDEIMLTTLEQLWA